MSPQEYISQQPADRKFIMNALHEVIIGNDQSVTPVVEPMMGKEMILYKECNTMKYGLAAVKSHLSLHCLPIYMNPALHEKYLALLPKAKVQKGCINFTGTDDFPIDIAASLIADCAPVNIAAVLENRKKSKK